MLHFRSPWAINLPAVSFWLAASTNSAEWNPRYVLYINPVYLTVSDKFFE